MSAVDNRKRPFTLKIRIPQYAPPRNECRQKIHAELIRTLNSHSVKTVFEKNLHFVIKCA
jgi:hypothetical protein